MTVPPDPAPATAGPAPPAAAPPPAAGPGVIHDIGYRRDEGSRADRGDIWRSLFVHSVLSTYGIGRSARSKVLPMILLGIMLLPALITVVVMVVTDATEQPLPYNEYAVALNLVVAVYLAAQAPQLFSRDLRFRTITLYFARPLTRFDYVSARFSALVTALVLLMGLPLLVLYAGGLLVSLPWLDEAADLAQALAGVVVFALVLAGIGALVASLTPRRGFAVAGIITLLTMSLAMVSTVQGIASVQGNDELVTFAGLFSPLTLADGFQDAVLGTADSAQYAPTGALDAALFGVVTAVVVAGAFGLLVLRYRRYRA
jgi:ABC-2 type transport system permease protein